MNKNLYLLICCVWVLCLVGCGGELAGISGDGAVSGGAVSEQAVVSEKTQNLQGEFCNDWNVYYTEYDNEDWTKLTITERNWKDHSERRVTIKDGDSICYVDNNWIYYTCGCEVEEDETADQFWRAPMEPAGDHRQVNWKKKELILEEKDRINGPLGHTSYSFCNGRWIAYLTRRGELKRYDMEKKKFAEIVKDFNSMSGNGRGALIEGKKDYILDGNTGEVMPIPDQPENYANVFFEEEGMFFTDPYCYDEEDEYTDLEKEVVMFHYPDSSHPQGWREILIAPGEIEELLTKEGSAEQIKKAEDSWWRTTDVFVREKTLYLQLEFRWKKEKVIYRDMKILRFDMEKKGSLMVDQELTQCLENPEENQKVFRKYWSNAGGSDRSIFFSRGLCVGMTEDYAFFLLADKKTADDQLVSYAFETGETKVLDKKEDEWYLLYCHREYHPAEEPQMFTDYMPNND
ncbi:MAG: hypothetical protein HFG34_09590 [Eubacterium sp.]|nr:hypothetical protein [Eubacterium sp.]